MIPRMSSLRTEALPATPTVLIVDDDDSLRHALSSLFRSVGLETQLFASAQELLQSKFPEVPSCLVLDIRMPGLSGLDFRAQLDDTDAKLPIVVITGRGAIPTPGDLWPRGVRPDEAATGADAEEEAELATGTG